MTVFPFTNMVVSIHASGGEATRRLGHRVAQIADVSIHASGGEATEYRQAILDVDGGFNPRLRGGGDQ